MKVLDITKKENYPLKEHTTLKIGGSAAEAYFPDSLEELHELKNALEDKKITVIGQGSNLLVSSQGVKESVIFTQNLKNYEFLDDTTIKVECGLKSAMLAKIALENSLTGVEFLIGIPGSVGGAVTMNSSAHGQAIEHVIESVEVIDLMTNEIYTLDKEQLNLSYRNSFVEKDRHLILSAVFKLEKGDPKEIADKMDFHVNYRKERHPSLAIYPNAGSTFRNPERNVYTGQLLQDMDAKGWREGGAAISDKHCNFIVNLGNATSLDVSRLMNKMYNSIKKKYGYELIAEIRYLGEPTEEEKEIWSQFIVH
ncbi:MAG: UDP-N-acetylmuramate dehydrogenase [Candidatus Gastranaerophilales bacterium]|nr:UDP-N-acetylmuramate dehydrogenase [Candidatus Gastranaerophilales bacterium]